MPRKKYQNPDEITFIQSRVPQALHRYCKTIVDLDKPGFEYQNLFAFWEDCVLRFKTAKPWEQGLEWKRAKATEVRLKKHANSEMIETGYIQVRIQLLAATAREVEAICHTVDSGDTRPVSKSAFMLTAIDWMCRYVASPRALGLVK